MNQPTTLRWIRIATVVLGLAAIAGAVPAMFAPMMFDAPGSENNPATKLLFFSVIAFPVTCIAAMVGSWVLYFRKKYAAARLMTLALVVNLILVVIAWLWLTAAYGGRLAG